MTSKKELLAEYEKYIHSIVQTQTQTKQITDKKENTRILSFNVQMFKNYKQEHSMGSLFKLFKESHADIIILYEALFGVKTKDIFYENVLASEYKYTKACNDKYGINIVLSKYPIESSEIISLTKDPIKNQARYAILVSINVKGSIVKLAGAHLDVYDETEVTRLSQIKSILEHIDGEYLLMGDFNSLRKNDYSEEKWKQILFENKQRSVDTQTLVTDFIEKCSFVDSFVKLKKNIPTVTVWCMRRVDYIYVGNKFKYSLEDCVCHVTGISDHFPLYIDLKI